MTCTTTKAKARENAVFPSKSGRRRVAVPSPAPGNPPTKLAHRAFMAAGAWPEALSLAAKFPRLGDKATADAMPAAPPSPGGSP